MHYCIKHAHSEFCLLIFNLLKFLNELVHFLSCILFWNCPLSILEILRLEFELSQPANSIESGQTIQNDVQAALTQYQC